MSVGSFAESPVAISAVETGSPAFGSGTSPTVGNYGSQFEQPFATICKAIMLSYKRVNQR
jgi:hypothetical protein